MSSKKKDNIINFPSSPSKLERQVEAILFAASKSNFPLTCKNEEVISPLSLYNW